MATQRQYENATVFNARISDMRHLWVPSDTYKGQKTQKPNYFAGFLVKKTVAHWSQEPAFGGVMAAFGKLLQGQFSAFAGNPGSAGWPILDGDVPNPEGKQSEHAKGHWLFNASSSNPISVELAQPNGTLVKVAARVGVKPGDFVMCGLTAAVSGQDVRRVKFYLNAVVFSAPGEEIVFANSVSGADLMAQAQKQGLAIAGFSGSPGFGGGGFTPPQPQGGFAPPAGAPAPGPFGHPAPAPGNPAGAPAHFGAPAAGSGSAMTFPSNQPGGFAPPTAAPSWGGLSAPAGGWPQR